MSPQESEKKPELPPETAKPQTAASKPGKPARRGLPFNIILINSLITLAELVLPLILTVVLLFVLARVSDLSSYSSQLLAAMFMLFLVLIALILAFVFTSAASNIRGEQTLTGSERTAAFRWRFVKLVLGGLIIPIAAGVMAITQEFSPGVTYLAQGLRFARTAVVASPLAQVGDAVIKSKTRAVKLEGIRLLAGKRSPAALEQLLRILQEDKTALADSVVSRALAEALAGYDLEARQQLITIYLREVEFVRSNPVSISNAYQVYFSDGFEALMDEVRSQVTDPIQRAEQLNRIELLQLQLRNGLEEMNLRLTAAPPAGRLAYFCLETFMLMNVKEDNDLLMLAKKAAADSSYPDRLRVLGFQLTGKLGNDPEVNWLYPYLTNSSEPIRAAVLSALADIQEKNKPAQAAPQKK